MIWLTWRQMRAQTLWTAGLLAALAAYVLWLAADLREAYRINVTDCTSACGDAAHLLGDRFESPLILIGLAVLAAPALIGAFWAAPLITRELETGTHRLAWNQTVTRRTWLTAKLALAGGAAVLLTGALALLLSWAAEPYDTLIDSRFEPLTFAARDLAPFGYALLAFTLGLTVGLITRKTLAAMALTLIAFAAFQITMATLLRPHYAEPVTQTIAFTDADTTGTIDSFGIGSQGAGIQGYTIPGAWVLDDYIPVRKGDGTLVTPDDILACDDQALGPDQCMAALDAEFQVTYQPADRYWNFQWTELGITAGLSALLTGYAYWRLPRGIN